MQFCESNKTLHNGQMGAKKNRSAIDAVKILVNKVQDVWKNGEIAEALPMDIKKAFDPVSQAKPA